MRYDGLLPYEFVEEPTKTQLIDHAGLLPYLDLACVLGVLSAADENIGACGGSSDPSRRLIIQHWWRIGEP